MIYEAKKWKDDALDSGLSFLKNRFESSVFLLGNYEAFGVELSDHPNSGNFYSITRENDIVAVFCLTKRGNLIVQADDSDVTDGSLVEAIVNHTLSEHIPVKGVIGPWQAASAVFQRLSKDNHVGSATFNSKEILYSHPKLEKSAIESQFTIRWLEEQDFEQWGPLRIAYIEEEGLSQDLSEEDFRKNYNSLVERKLIWGLFDGANLVAMTGLNSKAMDIGQVGGVYTKPEYRRRGLGKLAMKKMTNDCIDKMGIKRMILFTGESNIAAQKLYVSLSYQRIGHFGLIFC